MQTTLCHWCSRQQVEAFWQHIIKMAKLSRDSTIKLKSGYEIPRLGYGVSFSVTLELTTSSSLTFFQLWKT